MKHELGRLAGPGKLAERAGTLLNDGKPLEAIHLAEVALAAEPGHRPSLEIYIAAHRRLLAESAPKNRWFLYWLTGEIADAERRLAAS